MQILIDKTNKKVIRFLRMFQERVFITGDVALFHGEIEQLGGQHNEHFGMFTIPDNKEDVAKKLSKTIKVKKEKEITEKDEQGNDTTKIIEVEEDKNIEFSDYCQTEKRTDPTVLMTLGRLKIKPENPGIISMPNDTYTDMYGEICQSKNIQLIGELPEQNEDGSYTYFDGLLEIVPKDPPTQAQIDEENETTALRQKIKDLETAISGVDIGGSIGIGTTDLHKLLELEQCRLKLRGK